MSIDTQIAQILGSHAGAPFAWGKHDCCQFVRDALRTLTGRDISIKSYDTERGAVRALHALGGYDGAMAAYEAKPLASPLLAQRGDVVLVEVLGLFDGALALCTGIAAHAVCADGLEAVPQAQWLRAWRVPCLK
jgi:hypothetical protein